jgi:hypothetical protein
MKIYISTLLFLFVLVSCDNRKDYFETTNKKAVITIKSNPSTATLNNNQTNITITDSVKLNNPNFNLDFSIRMNQSPIYVVDYFNSDNFNTVTFNDKELKTEFTKFDTLQSFKLNIKKEGIINSKIRISDIYNMYNDINLNLVAFNNVSPKAILVITNTKIFHPNEYKINGNQSIDRDWRFGGIITEYEFSIGLNNVIKTTSSFINHIFTTSGTYAIRLRVKDNNDAWSDYESATITIN